MVKEKVSFTLNLARPAMKAGGDRYELGEKGSPEYMVLYFPQHISRPEGVPKQVLHVTLTYDSN